MPATTIGNLLNAAMQNRALTAYQVAKSTQVPYSRIFDLLHDQRRVSIDTSIRLGRLFNYDDLYFYQIQMQIDYQKQLHKKSYSYDQIK